MHTSLCREKPGEAEELSKICRAWKQKLRLDGAGSLHSVWGCSLQKIGSRRQEEETMELGFWEQTEQ
jgi:hypothetical protein